MRIGVVEGKVVLSRVVPRLEGQRWLLVNMHTAASLLAGSQPAGETLAVLDELGANVGTAVGVSEGVEAAMPVDLAPLDAYVACLLDEVVIQESGSKS